MRAFTFVLQWRIYKQADDDDGDDDDEDYDDVVDVGRLHHVIFCDWDRLFQLRRKRKKTTRKEETTAPHNLGRPLLRDSSATSEMGAGVGWTVAERKRRRYHSPPFEPRIRIPF